MASYPLGSGITPQVDRGQSDPLGLTCDAPHAKISIVSLPLSDPEAGSVRTKALSSDTEPYDPDGPYDPTGGGKPAAGLVGVGGGSVVFGPWQESLPESVKLLPASGTNRHSYVVGCRVSIRTP